MALVFKNRVKETCTAPGTGTVTLLGPTTGFVGFSTIGTTNNTYYTIADQVGNNWEVGLGTWTAGGSYGTLARTTVFSNSLGTTAKINFSSGTQDVFITGPSERYLVGLTTEFSSPSNPGTTTLGYNSLGAENNSVAIGRGAQAFFEGVAVGEGAGAKSASPNGGSIAIGRAANASSPNGISIGANAFINTPGNHSIAIGKSASILYPNSIALTASGVGLSIPNSGVFIDSIRNETAGSPDKTLKYNSTTKELFYGTGGGSVSPATNTTLGTVYGATGNTTSNVNNTGLGFDHVIGGSVVNSTIIGNNANVSQVGTTSFTTQGGVAVGRLASATNRNSVVIGANSSALNPESVVIGANATVSGANTVVIGSQSKTTGTAFLSPNSVVVGANASIDSSEGVVAIGNNVSVASGGSGVVAIGWNVTVPSDAGGSVAIGDAATINQDPSSLTAGNSIAILGSATGDGVVSIGTGSGAGSQSVAIGVGATAAGLYSLGLGPFAGATANGSIVLNADTGTLTAPNTGLFIKPIRDEAAGSADKTLKYNTTTKEVFYGTGGGGSGTVTDVSVVAANGFNGTVATSTTTPAITLTTTVTGVLKGNGTAISAATAGTDYAPATTGTSAQLLANNGTGGFDNITVGSGLSLSAGTLSAPPASPFPYVNPSTISQNITVTTGNNAMLVGPITVANGYSITVDSSANFVVVT